ncbi:tRNA (guanosine(46)-N7)-methyltransferase TrmB [Helicobacter burdigaliensis]|uniref:tRNA (guanosine(46)-N7)-methyltransferase TrmB n=1 Tax=Helicobacter burdigaliensis TaxID=2315334 RepID=UPI000EF6E3CE|nr:tRNA (guanosine(46)-N7)-methyltransferase TrmB [Helicobacter burdigaliensis]
MPHFKALSLSLPKLPCTLPCKESEFSFLELYSSCVFKNYSFLHTQAKFANLKPKEFFLTIKQDSTNQSLVKCDKSSKIAPIEIAKNALSLLAKDQQIITHNLNSQKITPKFKLPFIKEINDFLNFEEFLQKEGLENKEIWLEIGFGSGRHLLFNAKNNQDILHIGIEIHLPSLEQVARQIGLLNLKNIFILAYDARIFLELLPKCSLNKIFVHFPVPWDKKPHRRIFGQAFLKQCARVLKKEGILHLRTDSEEYFSYSLNLAKEFKNFEISHYKNKQNSIISKYEARWNKLNKDIYDLNIIQKNPLELPTKDYDFSFPPLSHSFLLKPPFKKQKFIKEDYFLSLEDLLISPNPNQKILKISFGDFNYPETRYIIINENLEYFREPPLKTEANSKAHNLLCSLLKE